MAGARRTYRTGACRHCGREGRIPGRGLCDGCYRDPAVRPLYPTEVAYRPWTARERADLAAWRTGGVTVAGCARRLGRKPADVRAACHRWRIVVRPQHRKGEMPRLVAGLHSRGLTDAAIARRLGVCRNTVTGHRRLLGLAVNREPAGWGMRRCVHRHGLRPDELARERQRVALVQAGWPVGVQPADGRYLAAVERLGAVTAAGLAAELGVTRNTAGNRLKRYRALGWVAPAGGQGGGRCAAGGVRYALSAAVAGKRGRARAYRGEIA